MFLLCVPAEEAGAGGELLAPAELLPVRVLQHHRPLPVRALPSLPGPQSAWLAGGRAGSLSLPVRPRKCLPQGSAGTNHLLRSAGHRGVRGQLHLPQTVCLRLQLEEVVCLPVLCLRPVLL